MPFELFFILIGACVSTAAAIFSGARLFTRRKAEDRFIHHLLADSQWCHLVRDALLDRNLDQREFELLMSRAKTILRQEKPLYRELLLECIEQPNREGQRNYVFKLASVSEKQLAMQDDGEPRPQADA